MFDSTGEGNFIKNLFTFFAEKEQMVLFDVGANMGSYSEMLLRHTKEDAALHVFEPTTTCFSGLTARFAGNKNVVLNKKAASDLTEEINIYFDTAGSPLASLYKRNLQAYSIEMNQFEKVATIRLDDYIKAAGLSHIHFLKLDVEGHEFRALKGLGSYLDEHFIDFIQFEYGGTYLDSQTRLQDVYEILMKNGFMMAKILQHGLEQCVYQDQMEDYQYANFVGISRRIKESQRFTEIFSVR